MTTNRINNPHLETDSNLHVAILLDGNGRWAALRGLPRSEGHREGVNAVKRVVEAAPCLGVTTLSLYAFSSNNWARPSAEVDALLAVLETYLRNDAPKLAALGVRLRVIGRRDRIRPSLAEAIERAEKIAAHADTLDLRIAIDYSSRESILRAACWMVSSTEVSDKEFARRLGQVTHNGGPVPDVDLLIRSGGERRLSDFLLWECAYAELLFTPKMWPEFQGADLEEAVGDFLRRERRFGRLPEAAAVN